MQKFTKILEQYVEWIAIALGAPFFAWMIWGFIIQAPVTVPVAGKPLLPGEVAPLIRDGPAKVLKADMQDTKVPPMPVQDFVQTAKAVFNEDPTQLTKLAGTWIPITILPTTGAEVVQDQNANVGPVVTVLPDPPAPVDLKTSQGRSNALKPAPGAAPATVVNGAQQPAGNATDINWISIGATIPMKPLAKAFTDDHIPTLFSSTVILRAQLIRQVQGATGEWGPETPMGPLTNVSLQAMPENQANPLDQSSYVQWAEKNQADLLIPPFYQVLQADPWRAPGVAAPEAVVVEQAFDPSHVADPSKLTPEQKKFYEAYRKAEILKKQQEAKERAAASHSRQPRPPAGGNPSGALPGGFPGGGPEGGAARRPTPGTAAPTTPPPTDPRLLAPGQFPGGAIPGMPGFPMPGANPGAQPGANPAAVIPAGAFNPAVQPDVNIWAHDDSVEPGKTYRYKLRYYIKNPVFQTYNVCKPQTLAAKFALVSADSDWTEAISVKSESNFFAVRTSPGRTTATFDIFRWKNGAWQKQTAEASPGDMVGTPEGKGTNRVDFSTGWILVDIRPDPRSPINDIILLTSANGQMTRHNLSVDRTNPDYLNLKNQVDNAAAANKTAALP